MKQAVFHSDRWLRAVAAMGLVLAMTMPVAGQSKKKDPKDQSEAARQALEKQRDIAKGLRDKKLNDPDELSKQITDLKTQIDSEKMRSTAAVAALEKDLAGFQAANDKKRTDRTQAAIEKEKQTSAARVADLEKRVADLQTRLDAAKAAASAPK